MNNKKSIIFIVVMIFFLMMGVVSAQENTNTTISEVSATVDDNLEYSLEFSSGKINESSQSECDIVTSKEDVYISNENTIDVESRDDNPFSNNDILSSNAATTQNIVASGETYDTFANLDKLINGGGKIL